MVGLATVSCTLEELMEVENEKHGQEKRSEWVVNAPEPPSLWRQLIENIKDTIFGRRSRNKLSSLKNQASPKRLFSLFHQFFPILASFRNYNAQKFKYDFMAGLTLATLSIPQSIGYATLAKLSPEYGLYTSIVPPLIYALLGTSRHIVIGPVAVDSLLLFSMIHQLKHPIQDYSAAYTALLLTVTFFTGIFQVAFGVFRLGFLVDYLSHATIVGFMAGAAVVICLQQMKGLFGIKKFTNNTDIISIMKAVCTSLSDQSNWHPYTFILGFSFLAFIVITRYLGRRNKKLCWLSPIAPLLSVIISSVIAFRINLHQHEVEEYRVEVFGEIKGGFNPSSLYQLQFDGKFVGDLIKTGLTVAVISLTEGIAVGRSFASLSGDSLNPNKEMVSLGLMNIVGSFTSCYVATASPSRTAVNYSGGSETVVSSIVMVITVLISLKFFTRFLYFTPKAVIASTTISTLPGLINFNKAYNIWKVDKIDFLACAGAFFGILLASVETGLIVAVMISFAKIIVISIQPGIEIVGRLPGTTGAFCDVEQYPMAVQIPRVLIVRVKSAWLCFANASFVRDRILRWVTDIEEAEDAKGQTTYKFLIVDMSSLMHIDTGAIASLEELYRNLTLHEVKLVIANPRWQVIHKLRVAKFVGKVGGSIFLSVEEAVDACLAAEISYPSSDLHLDLTYTSTQASSIPNV